MTTIRSHGYWNYPDPQAAVLGCLDPGATRDELDRLMAEDPQDELRNWLRKAELPRKCRYHLTKGLSWNGRRFDDVEIARVQFRPMPDDSGGNDSPVDPRLR